MNQPDKLKGANYHTCWNAHHCQHCVGHIYSAEAAVLLVQTPVALSHIAGGKENASQANFYY